MHFVSQVLVVSMSWGAGIKTADPDPDIDAILKAYGRLKSSLQAQRPNDFATLEELEAGLRKLNESLSDIPLIETGTEVADNAHTLLGMLDAMYERGRGNTWRSRINLYAFIANLLNPST
jgi:hypothetical protein